MRIDLHTRKTLLLLAETATILSGLAALSLGALAYLPAPAAWSLIAPLALLQGLWFDRLYTVAHEAVHRKLFPARPLLNDLVGAVLMLPIVAPFTIFRKIHGFHHGSNRRNRETAALDHLRVPRGAGTMAGSAGRVLWFFYVFAGGFFLHTLATILIFLLVPGARALPISPVFRAWPVRLRLFAWLQFAAGLGLHAAVVSAWGAGVWFALLGLPMIVFGWFWSMLLYIYHYRTTVGSAVRDNVRSLPRQPLFSWLLLNFNEHATHHGDPTIPWYALPERRRRLPDSHAGNDNVRTLLAAVLQQRRGPILWTPE